jgi:hypothetical protein
MFFFFFFTTCLVLTSCHNLLTKGRKIFNIFVNLGTYLLNLIDILFVTCVYEVSKSGAVRFIDWAFIIIKYWRYFIVLPLRLIMEIHVGS